MKSNLSKKIEITVQGKNIVLRTFSLLNITKNYLSWLNDKHLMQYSNQRFHKHTRTSSIKYLSSFLNSENLFFAIYYDEIFVGTMTAYIKKEHKTADIGILVGKEYQGIGIATDAWNTLMTYLLGAGIRKITGGALKCNLGMIKVMTKCGMELDGIRCKQEIVNGIPEDIYHYCKFFSL
jgi:RimJ/RimL family protein N-acetyltransferase